MKTSELKHLWKKLENIPFSPRQLREPFGTILFSLPDIPSYIFQNLPLKIQIIPEIPPLIYKYRQNVFSREIFETEDGLQVESIVAKKSGNKKTLIMVHGIFQSKNFRFIRTIASLLYERLNFNIVAIDIREHFKTRYRSFNFPASSGLLEGRDVLYISSQLKQREGESDIFLLGFSFGGTIVLNTAKLNGAKDVISGIIAVSPAMILENVVAHIDKNPGFSSPFYPLYNLFRICLSLRYSRKVKSFDEYLENSAKHYGLEKKRMMKQSSVTEFAQEIAVPTLILLSRDDAVIPGSDIAKVKEKVEGTEYIKMIVKDRGGHIAFPFVEPRWFYGIIEKFTTLCSTQ
jgi:predicted alpha/beta-fold hydrolase